jgi:hypothetical protein
MAEEQTQPILIVEGGAAFAAAQALAGRAVAVQEVQRPAANQGQVFRGVVLTGSAGIFTQLDVQNPVLLIFDAPVVADGGREPFPIRE